MYPPCEIRATGNSRSGIPGHPPSQEFQWEFPGITEFTAGICRNFKNLQIQLIFVQDFGSSLS